MLRQFWLTLTLPCNRALHPSLPLRAKLPIAAGRLAAEAGLSSTSASPSRRRRWIRGALLTSKASALVGGPPTDMSVPASVNSAPIGTTFLGRTPPSFRRNRVQVTLPVLAQWSGDGAASRTSLSLT